MRLAVERLLLLGTLFTLTTGCVSMKSLDSPYRRYHEVFLEGVEMPSEESIESIVDSGGGKRKNFEHSTEEVWDSCLRVATQYWGILGIDFDGEESRRMMFIDADVHRLKIGGLLPGYGSVEKTVERWILIRVKPGDANTAVADAILISPRTGKAAPLRDDFNLEGGKGSVDKLTSISEQIVKKFFFHIEEMMITEEHWLHKFSNAQAKVEPRAFVSDNREQKVTDEEESLQAWGNYTSLRKRLGKVVIEYPDFENLLHGVVQRLSVATGRNKPQGEIFTLSSKRVNAHVTPNGDLFITTGLLHEAKTIDEVAALIAHELSHYFENDYSGRAKRDVTSFAPAATIVATIMASALVATGVIQTEPPNLEGKTPREVIDESLLTNEELLVGTIVGLGAYYGSGLLAVPIGDKVSDSLFGRYSAKQEFRADADAVEYLWYAGYDHNALLEILKRLKQRHELDF